MLNNLFLIIFLAMNIFSYAFGLILVEDFANELKGWYFVGDQASGGASVCKAEVIQDGTNKFLKWEYKLQKTDKWEWCYTTVGFNFETQKDLSNYKSINFKIKSSNETEYIQVNLITKDNKLNTNKYSQYIIKVSTYWQTINIPFEKFRIVGWWKGRTKGYNSTIEFDKVVGFEFSKSGLSGEKGEIYIDDIIISQDKQETLSRQNFEIRNFTIDLSSLKPTEIENKEEIKIYCDKVFVAPFKNNKGKIPEKLYGTNWGMWLFSFPNKDLVKPLNIKVLRAGGNLMSRYNWRTGRYKDTSTGEDYIYELPPIDEFVLYAKEIGAEPLIQINMLGYAPNEKNKDRFEFCMDEKDAADLVYYLNAVKKYDVTYFEMDNEPFIWHFTHKDVQPKPISINEYFERLKKFVVAMRETQSKISKKPLKIFAPAICTSWLDWGTYGDVSFNGCEGAVDYFLKKCAEFEKNKKENPKGYRLIDVLSFHIYPRFRINWEDPYDFVPQGIQAMLDSTRTFWDEEYINYYDYNQARGIITRVIPRFNEWISKYYPSVELAITEINVDSAGKVNYPVVLRPLFMADVYGIAAKYGLDYIMQFCLNDYEGGFGMINEADEENVSYYVFKIFSENFDKGEILNTEIKGSLKLVSIYACRSNDEIKIVFINKNDFNIQPILKLTFDTIEKTFTYDFKKYTITLLKFNQSDLFEKINITELSISP